MMLQSRKTEVIERLSGNQKGHARQTRIHANDVLAPIAIDRYKLIAKPWPEDRTEPHAGKTIQVLPMVLPDRPIMETPSPFAGREFLTRGRIEVLIGARIQAGGIISKATSTSGLLPRPA